MRSRCRLTYVASIGVVIVLMACSFFTLGPLVGADDIPPNSQVTLLDQDYSAIGGIPENIVLGNNLDTFTSANLNYNGAVGAIEYKTVGAQQGSVYLGIEPFVNGNISIDLKVTSDHWGSSMVISGSTFTIQTQTMYDGRARVIARYDTSPTTMSSRSYDVPASSLIGGVNTINIMVSGTTKSVTVYFDSAHSVTVPVSKWAVQKVPYDPITMPILRIANERASVATWVSTYLYGVRETVSGGLVSAVPGNDYVAFGIDVPRDYANANGISYMASSSHVGVAWVDEHWLQIRPEQIAYTQSLLDAGWELGIHYSVSLNTLSTADALTYMETVYDQITGIFGRAPTTWCSLENKDNVTHANFAYNQLGMVWRNGFWPLANVGSLTERGWPEFWSKISNAQMVNPCFTHNTDDLTNIDIYTIGYVHFTQWVDNYAGKHIIGFNEYYHRIWNQVDTKVHYLEYTAGEKLRFSIECNGFQTRLLINFSPAESAVVLKNGEPLVKGSDYSVIDNDTIVLFGQSNDLFEISAIGAPSATENLQGQAGDAQANLSWDPPSYAGPGTLTYHLFRDNASIWSGTTTNYTDTELTNGQSYSYKVSATNDIGWGPNSTAVVVIPAGTPSAPIGLTATPGSGFIELAWSPPSSDGGSAITAYNIYRGTAAGEETLLESVGDVLAYTDTDVTNGQTYYYTVSAVNAGGEGARSEEASATPVGEPPAPLNVAATPGDGQVILTWEAPSSNGGSELTGYNIYRGTEPGSGTLLASVGNVLTFTDTAVTNGVTYYYTVSAVNTVGEGPHSDEVSSTPSAPATVPSAPQSLNAVPGDSQAILSWSAPSSDGGAPITSYAIYRGTTSGDGALLTTVGNVLTYTDTDVTNGQTYYYTVSAVNSVGESERSNEASATPATAPSADFNYVFINDGAAVEITGYHGLSGQVVIPSVIEGKPVTSIGIRAFYQNVSVTSVTIPSSVTTIGNYAFLGCTGLSSVTISEGVATIGERAFHQCSSLTSVTIPSSVTTIGNYAFYQCTSLSSLAISEGVATIGEGAFSSCSALTSITIPGSVTSIGASAFVGCTRLASVTISEGVTSIGARAFYSCTGLTTVTVLGSVTTIGDRAFCYCSGLTSVAISGSLASIGNYSFLGCTRLASITLPEGLTTIGERAFHQCTALTAVTIPSSVTTIGSYAFYRCTSMTELTFEGNAPTCGVGWIDGHHASLIIYYYEGATGFTTPTWQGVQTVMLTRD